MTKFMGKLTNKINMPTKFSEVKSIKDKYRDIVIKEISKLKSGYGLTSEELAKVCRLSLSQFRSYGFQKEFKMAKHNKINYFVK